MLDRLNDDMQAFVSRQEMAFIATADSQGSCDCSFRGHAALLFLDFTRDVIGLQVNGRAELVTAKKMREQTPLLCDDEHPGRRPVLWIVVRVEEAYVHCSKHIPLLVQLPKQQHWGTDDHKRKGGDFFHVAVSRS